MKAHNIRWEEERKEEESKQASNQHQFRRNQELEVRLDYIGVVTEVIWSRVRVMNDKPIISTL